MMTGDIVAIVLVFSATPVLLISILLGLKIKKDLPEELQGKWRAVISLIAFFPACYISFVFILLLNRPFHLGMITGSVLFAGHGNPPLALAQAIAEKCPAAHYGAGLIANEPSVVVAIMAVPLLSDSRASAK